MKRLPLLFALLFILSISIHAQFEYGKPEELKGLKKVFIDTGADMKAREKIIKEIEKAKLDLEILDSEEGAEIFLSFGSESARVITGSTSSPVYGTGGTSTTVSRRKVTFGNGVVAIQGKDKTKARIVLSFEGANNRPFESHPAGQFAKQFVKAYKEANK